VDRSTIYETTRDCTVDEALADANPLTQFGRAMKELGVEIILARSPQAKWRVERRHRVLQDRLVKSIRLKRISDLGPANEYLAEEFVEDMNERFHISPRFPTNGVESDGHGQGGLPGHLPVRRTLTDDAGRTAGSGQHEPRAAEAGEIRVHPGE
jgi:hypothetical protein